MSFFAATYRATILLGIFWCLASGGIAPAQESITSATPDTIKELRESAATDRSYAITRKVRADAYRELAASAMASAQTGTAAERESWLVIARGHQASAAEIDTEIARLEQQADDKETRAAGLEAAYAEKYPPAPPPTPGAPEPAPKPPPLRFAIEDVLGVWRPTGDDPYPFVIVQEDPSSEAYPYNLEAHTRDRVWTGRYTSFDAGHIARSQNARMVFHYKPKPEEMNPEIPLWARNEVAGKLEWRIELDEAGDEVDPRLKARWYPGEVEWKEGSESGARIVGDGKAREFELEPEYRLDLEEMAQPVLTVKLPGFHDPLLEPIEALIKLQRFFVQVSLPAKLAKEQGPSLEVTITGLKGGDSTTLTLQASGVTGYRPVTYSHPEAITIADRGEEPSRDPQFMSLNWIFGVEGARIDLSVESSEEVEFRFGDASERIPVVDSWVQRNLDRHRQAVSRLKAVQNSVLAGDHSTAKKEGAQWILRLIGNYERLLASDRLTDVHRHTIGDLYFGDGLLSSNLVDMKPADLDWAFSESRRLRSFERKDAPIHPLLLAYLEGVSGKELESRIDEALAGIPWTSRGEEHFAADALKRTSEKLATNTLEETFQAYAFGLYDGFVVGTGADQWWLVATGTDHFGRRVPKWERLLAAIGLASSAGLEIIGSDAVRTFATRPMSSRLGTAVRTEQGLHANASGTVNRVGRGNIDGDLPMSLKQGQRQQTRLELDADAPGVGAPSCALRDAGPPGSVPVDSGFDPLRGVAELVEDEDYIKQMYGPTAALDDPFGDRLFARQTRQTCNSVSTNWMIFEATGKKISEAEADFELHQMLAEEVQQGVRDGRDLNKGYGYQQGYPQNLIRRYARMHGAKIAENPVGLNKVVNLKYIHALITAGYQVKLILEFKGLGRHAIVVQAVEMNALGRAVRVKFFDPNVGRIIRMPAGDFKKLIAKSVGQSTRATDQYGILTAFSWSSL